MELKIKASNLFKENYTSEDRITVNQGGTSSGKTYSILQVLLVIALEQDGVLISVVSESLPHIKRGCERDFKNILLELGIYEEKNHNKTDHSFRFGNSTIEFFGADQPDKTRGPRRDYLFINECNNVPQETFDQLEVRTKKRIWLDYNPVAEFWVHTDVLPRSDVKFIKSTYLDNPYLDDEIVKAIEKRKDRKNWWRVYGLGETGILEGLIYENWKIVESLPESQKMGYGLDFGYSNDPTALIEVHRINDTTIGLQEVIYSKGLTNKDIYEKAKDLGVDFSVECIADSAEPKSIEELYQHGWTMIYPAVKGKDSINNGIQLLQQFDIVVTKSSVNVIKELRNYQWAKDKHGKELKKPEDDWNHALDAIRYYALINLKGADFFLV